jgi:tetratricopeptide (TPR) repeat protein
MGIFNKLWNGMTVALSSIEIYERLVHGQGQWQISNELANVYIGRANAMNDFNQNREALAWFEKAIEIYDALANQQGRQEFTGDLARVRGLYASTLIRVGEHDRGMLEADRAIPALERELARTERSDLKAVLRILKDALQKHQ